MGILQVSLFGNVRIEYNNGLAEVTLTREIQALLAYLLLHRHKVHSREVLADLFWGDREQSKARKSLNTALWKLKKTLEVVGNPTDMYLKNFHSSAVGFNKESQYWLDVEIFEEEINDLLKFPYQTVKTVHIENLEKVLNLYKGELMEGFYQDWVLRHRERLQDIFMKSLSYLMQYYSFRGLYEKGLIIGQQILVIDPLREDIHREIMKLYMGNGQRALAVRQYEICCLILDKELNILPMEQTQSLYRQILSENVRSDFLVVHDENIGFDTVFYRLIEASQILDLGIQQLQQALELLANYSKHNNGHQSIK